MAPRAVHCIEYTILITIYTRYDECAIMGTTQQKGQQVFRDKCHESISHHL